MCNQPINGRWWSSFNGVSTFPVACENVKMWSVCGERARERREEGRKEKNVSLLCDT